ncbi:MAG TPA: ABC transporter substrate-binding protein [Actinomycetota bacterium]|nr:ABC transporter substrate-binding protein [Actinomycetota bacterium]
MPRFVRRYLVAPMAVALGLVAAACGDTQPTPEAAPTPTGEAAFPVTITAANGDVTIGARPERIVSMSATATEMLFAVDAGEQVVAVDSTSNFPPEAPTTDLSAFEPNPEAVAELDPDLVIVSDDINEIIASLEALEISVIHQPAAATLEDTYAQIEQIGAATGNVPEAADLVASMRSEIERLSASVPAFEEPPTYYHELDQTFFSVTSETFIGQIYALAGLENIADGAADSGPYPQLSAEFIVDADPDLIFLADTKCCGMTVEKAARRPGWDRLTAVERGAVVELDDDVASRWGPRVVDLLRIVVESVSELERAA